jgi:hypothetical protein
MTSPHLDIEADIASVLDVVKTATENLVGL